MKKLIIETGKDNPILRKKSFAVKAFDGALKSFAKAMKETMIKADGLGLAAPQVGKNIRVVIITVGYDTDGKKYIVMINPVIVSHSDDVEIGEEGCLSLPKQYNEVERYHDIVVEFFNDEGARQVMSLDCLDARIAQHEIDHLDGILFVDRLTS